MNKTKEIKNTELELRMELCWDIVDLLEEYLNRVENTGTSSGYELHGGNLHDYVLKRLKKEREILNKLELVVD